MLPMLLFTLPLRKHLRFYLNDATNGEFFNSLLAKAKERREKAPERFVKKIQALIDRGVEERVANAIVNGTAIVTHPGPDV